MNLIINKNDLNEAPEMFMRLAGYSYIRDRRSGHDSFVRRLTRDFYPRFHVYIKDEGERVKFSLHLDQKRPSYRAAAAHSGEYDGGVVKREIERLKSLIDPFRK